MLTEDEDLFLHGLARHAARGVCGGAGSPASGPTEDALYDRLVSLTEAVHDRALNTVMIQLSLVSDGAKAVG